MSSSPCLMMIKLNDRRKTTFTVSGGTSLSLSLSLSRTPGRPVRGGAANNNQTKHENFLNAIPALPQLNS